MLSNAITGLSLFNSDKHYRWKNKQVEKTHTEFWFVEKPTKFKFQPQVFKWRIYKLLIVLLCH